MTPISRSYSAFLTIIMTILIHSTSFGLTLRTWDGDAGDNDFNNGINWSGNPASLTSNDSCVMDLTNPTISLSADLTIGALTITSTAGSDAYLAFDGFELTINGDLNADTDNNSLSDLFIDLNASASKLTILGDAYYDMSGAGIVYLVSITNNPGTVTYYGDVTCGNSATTASNGGAYPPGHEPNVIYDGLGIQTVTLSNENTAYFLSENLLIGDDNTPTVNLAGTGVDPSFGTYDGTITINGTLDIGDHFIIDCVQGGNNCPTLTINDGGALKIGGTGDFPNDFATDDLQLGSHLYFYGTNQTICNNMSTTSVGHLYLQGSGTKTWDISTEIKNDYSSSGTCTADIGNVSHDFNGSITIGAGTSFQSGSAIHTIAGNFTNNGTFTHQNGKFTFDGSSNQNIDGSNQSTFDDAEIDNAVGITVIKGPKIEDNLTFTLGDITAASSSESVYITSTGSATGANNNSHLVGYITKQSSGTSKFTYPVGDGTFYRPCATEPSGNGDTEFLVKYFNTSYSDLTTEFDVYNVSNQEYWTIDRAGSSPEDANIELSWNSNSGVVNINEIIVSHYNGTDWENTGVCVSSGNATNGQTITTADWDSFSPFTLGSTTANNPLPVTLDNLKLSCNRNGNPVINWQTHYESNSMSFNISISNDGENYDQLASIDAAGNSSQTIDYEYIDDSNIDRYGSYFQLSQIDFNGNETFFPPIFCNCKLNAENLSSIGADIYIESVAIFDVTGKKVIDYNDLSEIPQIVKRNQTILNSGYYIMRLTGRRTKNALPYHNAFKIVIQ